MTQVPWWGIWDAARIQAIGASEEMAPWTLGTHYDRPIPSRLAQKAGVPRCDFWQRKKLVASNSPFRWPVSSEARASLERFLAGVGIRAPGPWGVALRQRGYGLINLVYKNLFCLLCLKRFWRPWLRWPGRALLFVLANHELRDCYVEGLQRAGGTDAISSCGGAAAGWRRGTHTLGDVR